ncbi:MAG: DUF5665 domain-containing protein [Bacillota bacterium]
MFRLESNSGCQVSTRYDDGIIVSKVGGTDYGPLGKCMREDQEQITAGYLKRLGEKIDELSVNMEKMRLAEYIEMMENPRRLLYMNFAMGLLRGFGMAIGFTFLAAIVLWSMQRLVVLNLPLISDFIADIVRLVQVELQVGGPNLGGM